MTPPPPHHHHQNFFSVSSSMAFVKAFGRVCPSATRHLVRCQTAQPFRCMTSDAEFRPVKPIVSEESASSLPKSLQQKKQQVNQDQSLDRPEATAVNTTIANPQQLRYNLEEDEAVKLDLGAAMLRQVDLVNASRSELAGVERKRIVQHFQRRKGDTGSPEVQVALLNARIHSLAVHMKEHYHDKHSQRGLTALVNQRKKLQLYMQKTGAMDRYLKLSATLDPIGHFRPDVDTSFVRIKPI